MLNYILFGKLIAPFLEYQTKMQIWDYKLQVDSVHGLVLIASSFQLTALDIIPITILCFIILYLILRNLTKRKRANAEIDKYKSLVLDSETKYKYIVENANDGIYLCVDGLINFWNKKMHELTGYDENEILGKPIVDLIYPDDKQFFEQFRILLERNEDYPGSFEVRMIKKDGGILWADIRDSRFDTVEGYFTLSIVTDIANRKEYEERLRLALLKEKELAAMKSSIIAKISHEYRTPLTEIQTSVELLNIFFIKADKDKFDRQVSQISASIKKMTDFLEDVLLLGKIESYRADKSFQLIDIAGFTKSIVEHFAHTSENGRKIKFIANSGKMEIAIEQNLLNIIISRILSNEYFIFDDNREILVTLNVDNNVSLSFRGKANLEDLEDLYKLFELNYSTIENANSPSGFGLSIVNECVNVLDGELKIEYGDEGNIEIKIIIPFQNN